ncbi:MAG: hypothetical protein WCL51_06690 [Bacteroidota bacterium]
MKVTITAENYEEIVNKLTIDFIVKNGRLQEKLEKRDWMSQYEFINYFEKVDMDSMEGLQKYIEKNKIDRFEKGSTYLNLFDQYGKMLEVLMLLKDRGKKA